MDRFTLRIRESKYSDRCPIHTTDIASSHGVKAAAKLKRTLNQRSRASLRITERELQEAKLSSYETISDLIQLNASLKYYEAEEITAEQYYIDTEADQDHWAVGKAYEELLQIRETVQWYKEKIAEL